MGRKVIFITGTDEHGEKIASSAASHGSGPSEHCEKISHAYRMLWKDVCFKNIGIHFIVLHYCIAIWVAYRCLRKVLLTTFLMEWDNSISLLDDCSLILLMTSSYVPPAQFMKPLWRNFIPESLKMATFTVLTMRGFIVSIVRNIR